MADWRKLALSAFLADGLIDALEIKILKKELYADGKIDDEEINFLLEMRSTYQKKAKALKEEVTGEFENFFFKTVLDYVLVDEGVSPKMVEWLQSTLFKSKKASEREKQFLSQLKKKAKQPNPQLDKLVATLAAK